MAMEVTEIATVISNMRSRRADVSLFSSLTMNMMNIKDRRYAINNSNDSNNNSLVIYSQLVLSLAS